ncbi:MAG: protein kinase [Blastocatellia bacterium]|nr:protein kinase [Blastocatellia bacterium]
MSKHICYTTAHLMKQCPKCKQHFETGTIFCPNDGEKLISFEGEDPLLGELLDGKYLIEAKVARGSTASVYKARHVQLEIPVALKIMHSHLTLDKTAVERFRREAVAAMQIRHPNAIGVLDFAINPDGLVYVVTELLLGVSLREKVSSNHPFSLAETNEIMQQVCAAVHVAHKRNIIHRDLKPDNIFLHEDHGQQVVKVLDFGIAKLAELSSAMSPRLTRQGYVLGTPHYMSPEQCNGKEIDARADIYSLGVMLYEMLTGVVPFNGSSYSAIVIKKMREKPTPIYEIREEIPPIVNAVVMHALNKNPEERPETVQMFARELEVAIRAVTEEEFLKVFRTASEQELDAAIMLASEPGRFSTGPVPKVTGSFTKLRSTGRLILEDEDSEEKEEKEEKGLSVINLSIPNSFAVEFAPTLEQKFQDLKDAEPVEEKVSSEVIEATESSKEQPVLVESLRRNVDRYSELLEYTAEGDTVLRDEMLQRAKEIHVLLDVVIGDLEVGSELDKVFFEELRANVDALRAIMFHMHKNREKSPAS